GSLSASWFPGDGSRSFCAGVGRPDTRVLTLPPIGWCPSSGLRRQSAAATALWIRVAVSERELEQAGVTKKEGEEVLVLTKRRVALVLAPGVARRSMAVFADPNVNISGLVPGK